MGTLQTLSNNVLAVLELHGNTWQLKNMFVTLSEYHVTLML